MRIPEDMERRRPVVRRSGWRTIARWGCLPAAGCLLAGLAAGLGTASADSGPSGTSADSGAPGNGLSYTLGQWSGYVLKGGSYQAANAMFLVPNGVCTQGPSEDGPATTYWVGLQDDATIAQAGLYAECIGGQPDYFTWTADASGHPTPVPQPVQPGDELAVSIYCPAGGNTCTQQLQDVTQNWAQSFNLSVPDGFSANIAAVASESQDGGIYSDAVMVEGANVDTEPIGQYYPEADVQDPSIYGGTATLDPSPLDTTGMNFSFVWNGYTGS